MAARQVIVPGAMPSRDQNGRALPSALYFYVAGSALSSPATVYTSSALSVELDFPILSDAAGRYPQIWANEADVFDVAWTNAATGATIDTFSDISPLDDGVLASVALAEAAQEAAEAALAQMIAITAEVTGQPFNATSSTSLTIATGSKAPVLNESGKLYAEGQTVIIARESPNAQYHMIGLVESLAEDTKILTVTVSVASTPGSTGPFTDWVISQGSEGAVLSVAGETGVITAAELRAGADVFSTSEAKAFAVAVAAVL